MPISEWANRTKQAKPIVWLAKQGPQNRNNMKTEKLNQQEIAARLQGLNEWQLQGEEIVRTFQFKDFVGSMKFVNKVAEIAEAAQHHPNITINWNKVTLSLTTHDSGGLTKNDFDLAAKIDILT